jgi:hypothetical protein
MVRRVLRINTSPLIRDFYWWGLLLASFIRSLDTFFSQGEQGENMIPPISFLSSVLIILMYIVLKIIKVWSVFKKPQYLRY